MDGMVTIRDIAKESGYSVSTVSRVLNNRSDVSPAAKSRIEEVVERFHFVPNNNAKQLKQSSSKAIGVLVKGASNMVFADIVEEMQKIISRTAYTLVISYLDEEDDDEVEQALLLCRERKPVGLLFLGGNPASFRKGFSAVDVPCVLVSNRADDLGFSNLSSVATDDVGAARCAVDTLFSAGHERIGIIGGSLEKSFTSYQRFLGCEESFRAHGMEFVREHCYEEARFSFESAYLAMQRLVGKYPDLTAVFAMSDVMAIGAVRALCDMGRGVPEDVSVVGFDGIPLASYYNPKISTIRQRYETLAKRGIEILFGQMELKSEAVHETVPYEFIGGESIRAIGG